MIKVLILAISIAAASAIAQGPKSPDINDPSRADLRILNQSGSLFSVQLEPGHPVSFYIVGNEEAEINFLQLQVVIRNLSRGSEKILQSHQEGNHFIIDEPLDLEKPTDLEVTAKSPNKSETFHFKVSNVPR